MYVNLCKAGVGGFTRSDYWGSSEGNAREAWGQIFITGKQYTYYKYTVNRVRAVRAFQPFNYLTHILPRASGVEKIFKTGSDKWEHTMT